MLRLRMAFSYVWIVLLLCAAALSQTSGNEEGWLRGILSDENGAVVPEVTIKISDSISGTISNVLSDHEGRFRVELPQGTYDIRVEKLGFCPETREGLRLSASHALNVNFRLVGCALRSGVVSDARTGKARGFSEIVVPYMNSCTL